MYDICTEVSQLNLVMLGLPGAGKGTQARLIAQKFEIPTVSSGDLFRDHDKNNTKLGILARDYMLKGAYVPDDVTIRMITEWVSSQDKSNGFILDGFPRTISQAKALDDILSSYGGLDMVIYIDISVTEATSRISTRVLCSICQSPFSLLDGVKEGDACKTGDGGMIYQRPDDKPSAVEERIKVYSRETQEVVQYYQRRDNLRTVLGSVPINEVKQEIINTITSLEDKKFGSNRRSM